MKPMAFTADQKPEFHSSLGAEELAHLINHMQNLHPVFQPDISPSKELCWKAVASVVTLLTSQPLISPLKLALEKQANIVVTPSIS